MASSGSDRRLACAGQAKNVAFPLSAGLRYWLQLTWAETSAADVLISPSP